MEMQFGLIGFGAWGSHHARAIVQTPGARLTAISDASEDNRRLAKKEFPAVDVLADYRELVARPELEIVDIATPSFLHEEMAVRALEAGKHVILEKPMAVDERSCNAILSAVRRTRKVLNVVHEFRVSVQWGAVKKYISEGRLGDPLYLLINLWRRPYRLGSSGWRWDRQRVGSWILEEPIHFFDLALWYFQSLGDPDSIFAQANSRGREEGLCDNFSALIRWKNGAYVSLNHTLGGFEHHHLVELVGTKGALRSWWGAEMDRTSEPSFGMKYLARKTSGEEFDTGLPEEIRFPGKSGELFELKELIARSVDSVKKGTPFLGAEEGRKSVLLCLLGEESARMNKEVPIRF
ncbi:MAG: oxidoreductase domain protein [Deltaproteobacteria bacterium]|nr:oxidoreductase domain protein [Deltaproteobacteria bacterium]